MTDKLKTVSKKKIACLLSLFIMVVAFAFTWAYYSDSMALANPLGTSHSGAAIVEEYNPSSSFLPGETVVKKVAFQNTGKMDIFLRVEVPPEEGWYRSDNNAKLNDSYDVSKVIKNWNTTVWPTEDEDETDLWTQVYQENGKKYRYYKKILSAGAATDQILNSITLDPSVSNDRHDLDYSDRIYKLTFCAEAVPVAMQNDAYHVSLWNMTVTGSEDSLTWTQK